MCNLTLNVALHSSDLNNVYKTEIIEIGEQKEATDILILPGVGNFEFVKNRCTNFGVYVFE